MRWATAGEARKGEKVRRGRTGLEEKGVGVAGGSATATAMAGGAARKVCDGVALTGWSQGERQAAERMK